MTTETRSVCFWLLLVMGVFPVLVAAQDSSGSDAGWQHYLSGDYSTAAKLYLEAAEAGDAEAQYMLGEMYSVPMGVEKDDAAALRWYRAAGEAGHVKAQLHLGWMYYNGKGVASDLAESAAWYRRAAEQGDTEGQRQLGRMYYSGQGLPQDYAQGMAWFRKAAELGKPEGQMMMAWMYSKGFGAEKDLVEAYAWCWLCKDRVEGGDGMLERIAADMTPVQIAAGEKRAGELQEKYGRNRTDG